MQTDILLKQIHSSIAELKVAIDKFEKQPAPSTQYSENLYKALNEANKLVSAYLVIKEKKDVAPDLDLHLKIMNVPTPQEKQAVVDVEPVIETKIVEPIKEEVKIVIEEIKPIEEPKVVIEDNLANVLQETSTKKEYPKVTININDKFRFINELFKANSNEYNIAIEQINAVTSLDEANTYLKGLKTIYQWDDEHEMVKKITSLTQKRFV